MPDPASRQPVYLGDDRALTRTIHGHAIFVDTRDLASGPRLLLDGTAGPAAAAGVREAVRPGDLVLEVGSGFGELTLLAEGLVANGLDARARVETGQLAGARTPAPAHPAAATPSPVRPGANGLRIEAAAPAPAMAAPSAPSAGQAATTVVAFADVVLTREPLPPAFTFVMRVEPAAGAPPSPAAPAPAGVPEGWLASDEPDGPPLPLYEERPGRQRSRLCTQEQFDEPEYARWVAEFKQPPRLHRKQWAYVYICRALEERGMLRAGRRGIGFDVGSEPLPALFASYGAEIVASDLDLASASEQGWLNGNQHAAGREALNRLGICPSEDFRRLVSFRVEDMNAISPGLDGQFDFTWSSCCFEHLGSIEHGLRVVEESIKLLKPGGVVIFRRRDIDRLAQRLTRAGQRICLDYGEGDGPADRHVDLPPYKAAPHLRLLLMGYVSTSIGLIVERGEA